MKQRANILLVGGVLALALFSSAMAGPLEDGEAAYERGDYSTAERLLRPLAEQGLVDAQVTLGLTYEREGDWTRRAVSTLTATTSKPSPPASASSLSSAGISAR